MSAQVKRSLKSKLLAITASIMLLMSTVTLSAVAWMNYVTENARLADVEQQIRHSIFSRGTTMAESNAFALKSLVADNAFSDVQKLVARAVAQEEVIYGAFVGSDNQAWAYVAPTTKNLEKVPPEAWRELGLSEQDLAANKPVVRQTARFGNNIQEFSAPVTSDDGERLGRIIYGLSTERLASAVSAARERSQDALQRALLTIGGFGVFSLLLGIFLVRRAAARMTEPIADLTAKANVIAKGERGVRADIHSGDEVEVLAGAFNHMLEANEEAMVRLEETTKRALEADRMKSEFLANMSHEIRTPMNGVLGVVKLMQAQPLDNKLWRYVETIDSSANALLTIINDILDFSKLEAGKYTISSVPFQPKVVVQEVAELLAARAHDKNLELVYRTDPALPSYAIGDPDRLKQVLTNLVGNAIKFTDKGEVFINMTVGARNAETTVLKVAVHDSGIGIDSAHLPKLYEVFSQADGSMVRKHGGTGLGLAICKRLLKMMGGDIEVTSKVGQGSVFTFTVTLGIDGRDVTSARPISVTGKRVLVAEASRWRDIIAEHLQVWEMPHEIVERGSNVLPVLQRARSEKRGFDALVLGTELVDLRVPDLIKQLRADPLFKALPIILLAKVQTDNTLTELERDDAVLQLHKPIRFSELYNCLASSVSSIRRASVAQLQPLIQSMSSKKVLVVDDNEINQFVAVEQLEQLGYRADVANNGLEAFEKVKRGGYAAVLMDCQMPVMDGYTATTEIRKWEGEQKDNRHVPIIALTAHALAGERERVLNAGMDDYLSKPCRPSALEKMLRIYTSTSSDAPTPGGAAPAEPDSVELTDDNRSEKLIRLFLSRFPDQLKQLSETITSANAPEVRAQAHKLKGGCLALGASAMAKLAERLQKDAEGGDLTAAVQIVTDLGSHYQTVEGLLLKELAVFEARADAAQKNSVRPS